MKQQSACSEGRRRRILVPTDFSPCAMQALMEAVKISRDWRAAITLLHVVDLNLHTPPTGPVDEAKLKQGLWKEGLDNLNQTIAALGEDLDVTSLIREGLPEEEIVETAKDHDLIVIGRRKQRPLWRVFSRRTAKGVLENAPCPVLVVREHDKNMEAAV